MLSKIGVTAKVNAIPRAQYFPKAHASSLDVHAGLGRWSDRAMFTLQPVLHSRNDKGDGDYNGANTIPGLRCPDRRRQAGHGSQAAHADDHEAMASTTTTNVYHIPIHLQVIPWACAPTEVTHRRRQLAAVTWIKIK